MGQNKRSEANNYPKIDKTMDKKRVWSENGNLKWGQYCLMDMMEVMDLA